MRKGTVQEARFSYVRRAARSNPSTRFAKALHSTLFRHRGNIAYHVASVITYATAPKGALPPLARLIGREQEGIPGRRVFGGRGEAGLQLYGEPFPISASRFKE
jgi:hypothetical protein